MFKELFIIIYYKNQNLGVCMKICNVWGANLNMVEGLSGKCPRQGGRPRQWGGRPAGVAPCPQLCRAELLHSLFAKILIVAVEVIRFVVGNLPHTCFLFSCIQNKVETSKAQ